MHYKTLNDKTLPKFQTQYLYFIKYQGVKFQNNNNGLILMSNSLFSWILKNITWCI